MAANKQAFVSNILNQWRTRILNTFLVVVAPVAVVMTVVTAVDAFSRPGMWPAVALYCVMALALTLLAIFRKKIDLRVRAWGVLLVPYVVGVTALATYGLGSGGRLYLLALPVCAVILIGVRSGIIMSGLSVITLAVFTMLAQKGWLGLWLVGDRNSLAVADWLAEGVDSLMLLLVTMTLQVMFYRFQEGLIDKERKARMELKDAQELLEKQNAHLEEIVRDRTEEVRDSNRHLAQRNEELTILYGLSEAMTKTLDIRAMTRSVGDNLLKIFDTDALSIMLLDQQTNLIHVYYEYDKKEGGYIENVEPFPLGKGLTSKVILTRQPLLLGTLEEEVAHGAYFPRELLEKSPGELTQSWLGVPIIVQEKVHGVIFLGDYESNAFNENHLRLLQTIGSGIGVSIENARLLESAQESQRRTADIIEFLPDAALVIDNDGRVIAWNQAMEEMTGVLAEAMLGKDDHEYALPFYGERVPLLVDLVGHPLEELRQRYPQIRRAGSVLADETLVHMKGGARYLQATASALNDAKGNPVGAIEIIRDISERRRAQEELQKAKEMAEAATQAKSAFLANMSHELRTPLNAIIGFTRIVRRKSEGVLPEKQVENLDKVLVSADNLLNLINTVLDIAKIEAGRMEVLAANFRIGALIDLCANTVQPLLRLGVALEKVVDGNLSTIYSDQDKIRQIILNLLSNAAKFTHDGKITISAWQEGDLLRISVADTGIGISDEALAHIFKEFQQADTSTTRQYGGTGLGLSISRNLAHILGGEITVESEIGKGSTFTLVIPTQYRSRLIERMDEEPEADQPGGGQLVERGEEPKRTAGAQKRLLVIDDDPDAVYLLQEDLDPREYQISGVQNPMDGVRTARELQPDAILLDVVMPGADGWQVLHDLKKEPETRPIPVILTTIINKKAFGFRLGAVGYLLKPLDGDEVRETLERIICSGEKRLKQVLVVDDDPNAGDRLRQVLPEGEYTVETAADGMAGLDAIAKKQPDLVLLDILMPGLDGFGVIERLRANPETRELPIIVVSAKDFSPAEANLLEEKVSLVMKKQGLEGKKLAEEIEKTLKSGGRANENDIDR